MSLKQNALLFALSATLLSGCFFGGTRYSHFARSITAPIASTPLQRVAEVSLNAVIQDVQTSTNPPAADDPSLLVPELQFGLNARFALPHGFYLGGYLDLAFDATAAPNYRTTPDPTTGDPVVFSGGPDIGIARSFGDSPVSWGVFGSLTASLGWLIIQETSGNVTQVGALMGFYRVGVALHFFARTPLSAELGVAVQNYVINDIGGHLSLDQHGAVPYVGMRAVADIGLYGYAQLHFPLGFEYTNVSPVAGVLGIGWTFGDLPENY